jgi:formyl-CoA transferase
MGALDGLRILDLTQWEAGTSCTQLLALLGADVVKVEQVGVGDPGRHAQRADGDALYFLAFNPNKRSLALNLKSEAGRKIFLDMLPNFDVVAENYSLGVMEGFGLGYDVLKAACPGIIYATVKGFGTHGPYAKYLAFDPVAQAMGGAFSVNGQPGGPPLRPGLTFGDTGSGLQLAVGLLAAYVEKTRTGLGQMVEVSMQEAMLNFARNVFSDREERPGGVLPRRGNRNVAPTDLYPCAPGGPNDWVHLTVASTRMWDTFTVAIGQPELAMDERFDTVDARRENGDALYDIVAAWTSQRTKHDLLKHFGEIGVPCGAVLDSAEIFSNEHLRERGAIMEMDHPQRGKREIAAPAVRLGGTKVEMRAAPLLGQHSRDILREELGLDEASLDDLVASGVIGVREIVAAS